MAFASNRENRLDFRPRWAKVATSLGANSCLRSNMLISRRSFVASTAIGGTMVALPAALGAQPAGVASTAPTSRPAKPAPLPDDEVRGFVGAAHGNITRVREMLAARPSLVNATWDWGGGDFETALGGASHMGRPDIARVLLDAGARIDLFAAAMLGYLPIVRSALEVDPSMLNTPGPHGIPLIAHAERGGENAKLVLDYLRSIPG
jgi:hypothetical protein